jgi:hypothetical protein
MKTLLTTLCLTIAVLLGSVGVSWSGDFQKGLTAYHNGNYASALVYLQTDGQEPLPLIPVYAPPPTPA